MRCLAFFALIAAALVLPSVPAEAAGQWYQATSSHFTVMSDGGEAPARAVAEELERFRRGFETVLQVRVESAKPFTVIAVRNEAGMRRVIPWAWERRGGVRPTGVFLGGEGKDWAVLRTDVEHPTEVVVHEYVHSLVRLSMGALPPWLDEGLAEFYGAGRVEADAIYVGETMSSWQVALLRRSKLMRVADLVTVERGSADYTDRRRAGVFYAESFLLTHFLLLDGNGWRRPSLDEFLRLRREGVTDREALTLAFGGADALDRQLREYLDRGLFPFAKVATAVADVPIPVRELRPAEVASFLAEFLLHTGQLKTAGDQVAAALRAEPGLGSAHLQRGLLLYRDGRRDEAAEAFGEARRLAPDDATANFCFGTMGSGTVADACSREEALRAAIRLAPTFAPARVDLAVLLVEEDRAPDEALRLAREAFRLDPASVRSRLVVLDLETRMGLLEAANEVERDLWRAATTDDRALSALASYYENRGAPEKAEYILRRARGQNPHNVGATQRLASLLTGEGWPDESDKVLREGLAVERHSAALLNELAYLDADRGIKLGEALALADQALELQPGNATIQDTRAWALFRLARYREAEALARRSLKSADRPYVREHLGDILEREGRLDIALAEWKRALASEEIDDGKRGELEAKIARVEALPAKARAR